MGFDYVFLSPIFDSISKVGYRAAFSRSALRRTLITAPVPVIALGGITVDRLIEVADLGFAGAATLGAVWNAPDPLGYFQRMQRIVRELPWSGEERLVAE